ncbi:MAG TPA: DHA2 family efflux MFS transporter permease subunit [Beijerinckiaceae bacterium]|jgi:EmrB/QacA subfamily drug resistance transporter|nr:DHA2 family efflux MFS transporter permease subunit [Beijerinckiaceae bacterium]
MISKSSLIALIVACAMIMQTLDSTIVTTAIPQIANSFGVSPVNLSGAITSYILSLAVFIPISGWVADRFGARTVFQAAIVIFTVGSTLCGLSNSTVELTSARVLQGVGGAMLVPVGRLVLLRSVEKSELVQAMAVLAMPTQIGPLLGPPVGGFITTYFSWRWIFLINVPIGILGFVLATLFIKNFRENERPPLDFLGFVLSGVALSCLLYGLESLGRHSGIAQALGFIGIGLVVGTLSVLHAKRSAHPLINLSLVRIPTFAVNFWGGTVFRAGMGGLSFLLPLLFQTVFGMTALASGLLTFANAIGSFTMKASTPPILRRFGFRNVLIWNGLVIAASVLPCLLFRATTPTLIIFLILLANGFFQSLQYSALNALPYADVPPQQMSGATSLAQLMQQVGKAAGIAVAAVTLELVAAWNGNAHLGTNEFFYAFLGTVVFTVVSLPFCVALSPDAGAELSGYPRKTAPSRQTASRREADRPAAQDRAS